MRSFIRFRLRRSVVLPQPDGPMNAVTRVLWMSRLTSRIATAPQYDTATSSRLSTTAFPSCGIGAVLGGDLSHLRLRAGQGDIGGLAAAASRPVRSFSDSVMVLHLV